jgi:Max protein
MSLDLDLDQFNEHNIEIDDGDMTGNNHNQAEKRAHHNALERKRRDHIKGSFNDLRDVIPLLKGEKVKQKSKFLI